MSSNTLHGYVTYDGMSSLFLFCQSFCVHPWGWRRWRKHGMLVASMSTIICLRLGLFHDIPVPSDLTNVLQSTSWACRRAASILKMQTLPKNSSTEWRRHDAQHSNHIIYTFQDVSRFVIHLYACIFCVLNLTIPRSSLYLYNLFTFYIYKDVECKHIK